MDFRRAFTAAILVLGLPWSGSALDAWAAPADRCGAWRWNVKTLSDPDASQVNFVPVAKTISQLRQLQKPDRLRSRTPRLSPVELRTYRVRGHLVEYKRESDRDFHVVIAQPNQPSRTMIVEVVDPTCPGARDSARLSALRSVRQEFVDLFGQPRSSFTEVPSHPTAFVIGVGFFDELHGQRGLAPNGIELHPVLDVELFH